jgi:hypothetical protein
MNPPAPLQAPSSKLQSSLLQAVFRVHGIGQSVEDEDLTKEMVDNHGIDEKSIAAVKKLFTEQLKPFRKAANKARAYHVSRTFEGFGASRLIVATEQSTYTALMEKFIAEIENEKRAFIDQYPVHIERERQLKADAFKAEDYPPREKLEQLFRVNFLIMPMALPSDAVCKQLLGKYAEKYEEAIKSATENVRRQTLGMMLTLIAQTAESLAGDGPIVDSENKKGPLAKLREFLDRVPNLNITGDATINALAAECSKKLDVSTELLRNSKTTRKAVATIAIDIAQRFGAQGRRKLAA